MHVGSKAGRTSLAFALREVLRGCAVVCVATLTWLISIGAGSQTLRGNPAGAAAHYETNVVRDCGADPSGQANSTAALQECLADLPNGAEAYIPVGIYLVSGTLTVADKTAVRVVGGAGGSFGAPVFLWQGPSRSSVIEWQNNSYSSLEHLRMLESNPYATGPTGQIGVCVDIDGPSSEHDRFDDIQCRAPWTAGVRLGGINHKDHGHHSFSEMNVICDGSGGDAVEIASRASTRNRFSSGEVDQCNSVFDLEGGSFIASYLTMEWDQIDIHVVGASGPVVLFGSQAEGDSQVLAAEGVSTVPILIKNSRFGLAEPPAYAVDNRTDGPLDLQNNEFNSDDSSAINLIGEGDAFAVGSTLLSIGNFFTLSPAESPGTPFNPGPERVISVGDVGYSDNGLNGGIGLTVELPTIIEGPMD